MNEAVRKLTEEYTGALEAYLMGSGETVLMRAYELGRRAVADGLGVLEWTAIHHDAMTAVLLRTLPHKNLTQGVKAAADFFAETLSPFESTHRGFKEASTTVRAVLQFAAVLCHELRSPLASVMIAAEMLKDAVNSDPQSATGKLLEIMVSGAMALKARTDDLTDIVGFQSGTLSICADLLDIGALLRQLGRRLEPEVTRAGLKLSPDLPENLPCVQVDPRRLEQVVTNLVQNAIKYGLDGGRIDLRARTMKSFVVVEVQDYGKGISLPDQSILFQLYSRPDRSRKHVRGLGIGLALCRQLVEAHGGRLWVESEVGKGSAFKFSLPLPSLSTPARHARA